LFCLIFNSDHFLGQDSSNDCNMSFAVLLFGEVKGLMKKVFIREFCEDSVCYLKAWSSSKMSVLVELDPIQLIISLIFTFIS
jgi:hypothetical protein